MGIYLVTFLFIFTIGRNGILIRAAAAIPERSNRKTKSTWKINQSHKDLKCNNVSMSRAQYIDLDYFQPFGGKKVIMKKTSATTPTTNIDIYNLFLINLGFSLINRYTHVLCCGGDQDPWVRCNLPEQDLKGSRSMCNRYIFRYYNLLKVQLSLCGWEINYFNNLWNCQVFLVMIEHTIAEREKNTLHKIRFLLPHERGASEKLTTWNVNVVFCLEFWRDDYYCYWNCFSGEIEFPMGWR